MTFISLFLLVLTVVKPLLSALPNVTIIPIGEGTCSGFPATYNTSGRSANAFVFHPSSVDDPTINTLPTYITGDTLIISLTNTNDPSIFCCEHGGTVYDGFETNILLIPANSSMMQLQYLGTGNGIKPETYAHEMNGIRQNGTFLGSKNVTTWAFGRLAKETSWRIRLLGVGSKELQDGELKGFLKFLAP